MDELKKVIEALGRAFEEFKSANDQRLKQIETKGSADPLLQSKVDKANEDISRLSSEREALQKQIDQMSVAMNRKEGSEKKEDKAAELLVARKAAFEKLLRKGEQALSADELKTLSVSDDTQGGYLVTPEMESAILRNLANNNAFRALADVRQLSRSNMLEQPRRTAGISATWTGENGSNPTAANPTFGMLRIAAEEMRCLVKATAQMLEDTAYNVEGFVQDEASEAFANAEGAAFLSGNGIAKPRGILTYTAGTSDGQVEQIVSGDSDEVKDSDGGANGLIGMVHKLKAAYAANGKFLLNRATTGSIRKLKDSNKNYIWAPGLAGNPPTILGHAYIEDDNMPVEGANNLVVVLGDFKKFYKIVDKVGMAITRDPYSSKPSVEYLFRRRVGGDVEIFEAAKILKCST